MSPERLLVSAEVEQVVVPGSEGDFTMLARHAPVLTGLGLAYWKSCRAAREQPGAISFAAALPRWRLRPHLRAQTAIDLDELHANMLAQAIEDAEEDVTDAKEGAARDRAKTKLDHLRQVQATLNL